MPQQCTGRQSGSGAFTEGEHRSPLKNRTVTGLLPVMAVMIVAVFFLDWSRLFTGVYEEHVLSRTLKLFLSLPITLLAWNGGPSALNRRDRMLLRSAFLFVVPAEIAFYSDNGLAGIGLFACAVILFLIRNGTGAVAFIGSESFRRYRAGAVLLLFMVAGADAFLLWRLFLPRAAENPLIPMIVVYSLFLCCSVYIGMAAMVVGVLPRRNAVMVAASVVLLYGCDITVGLNMVLPCGIPYVISSSLTWMLYLPSLTLMALSGYRWEGSATVHENSGGATA